MPYLLSFGENIKFNYPKNVRMFVTWGGISNQERISRYVLSKARTINVGLKGLQKINPNIISKSLVLYGENQGSTVGLKLSQFALDNIFLTEIQKEIIIGIMLGDGYINKPNNTPKIQHVQGYVHLSYSLFLFQFLAPLCNHFPSLVQQRDGSFSLNIHTRCLACLNPIYDLFIVNGIKQIPLNIGDWLTPRSLAFWSMDDGSASESGFYLNTLSFSFENQLILQKVLKLKFNLDTNIHKHGDKFKLYIVAKSMVTFKCLVLPYFHTSFYYKLGIKSK